MRILIPSDGSACSCEAIRFISERAGFMGDKPEVELLNIQSAIPAGVIDRFGLDAVRSVYEAEGRARLEGAEKTAERTGLEVESAVRLGECGPVIAREAEATKADMIAMGTRGLSPAKSLFLGSVSRSVLERTTVPVLLVREEALPKRENLRILLATDGSDYGEAAAAFIAANPALFGPAPVVDVICVANDFVSLARNTVDGVSPGDAPESLEKAAAAAWENAVAPVLGTLSEAGIDAKPVRREGDPAEAISAYANENADIIVMGSHGYGRIKAAVLGSTAAKVAAFTKVPVLVIRVPESNVL